MGALYYQADKGRSDAQDRLDAAVAEGSQLTGQKSKLLPVQAQRARIQQARTALQSATASEVLWSHQLDLVRQHLSENVGLTSFAVTPVGAGSTGGAATSPQGATTTTTPPASGGAPGATGSSGGGAAPTSDSGPAGAIIANVAMAGVANTPSDVANWLDTLDELPGWSNVYAQNVTRSTTFDGYTYTLSADFDSSQLANRNTPGS
jgi:hypothetical protein